jgi:hypothetical protein
LGGAAGVAGGGAAALRVWDVPRWAGWWGEGNQGDGGRG